MRIFSGIRPTGNIHIGNYLGAIKQWVEIQDKTDCIFCIVDWHAITTPYNPKQLQQAIRKHILAYLAAGINAKKSIVFVQSQVKEHAELAWLLGTILPIGELYRMTQYKEKSQAIKQSACAGLLNYPILMTADILLYQTNVVPVGKDQQQHVELARDIARKFNRQFGKTFVAPEVKIPKIGAKIMDLQDPNKKMSKSGSQKGCIGLFDSEKQIKEKVMSAITDAGKQIKYSPVKKPGISNLLTIYSLFSGRAIRDLEEEFEGRGYAEFKKYLANLLIDSLEPFRKAQKQYSEKEIQKILDKGTVKARKIAQKTIIDVRKKMGLN